MNLYEIQAEYLNVLNNLEVDEDGCVTNIDMLEAIQGQFEDKLESCALYIKNMDADIEAIKKEEENLKARRKVLENKTDRLRTYVADSMVAVGKDKFASPKCALSFRRSQSVNVIDTFMLPDIYIRRKTIEEPNKEKIKEDLKNGVEVQGAELVTKTSLQIK